MSIHGMICTHFDGLFCLMDGCSGYECERFFENLVEILHEKDVKKSYMVIDNLKAALSPKILQMMKDNGVRVIKTPTYSPDLNAIEPAWGYIKKKLTMGLQDMDPEIDREGFI